MNLMSDDLDMTDIISTIQNDRYDSSRMEGDFLKVCFEICEREAELTRLKECVLDYQSDSFNQYQSEVMKAAKLEPIDHIAIEEFLTCFTSVGKIAKIAKKAFRDYSGVFHKSESNDIFIEGCRIKEAAIVASSLCENHAGKEGGSPILYLLFGIIGKIGGVVGKIIKVYGHDHSLKRMTKNERVAIAMEISDILWYIAALACVLGYDLSEIAKFNIEKLRSSLERGATGD